MKDLNELTDLELQAIHELVSAEITKRQKQVKESNFTLSTEPAKHKIIC